MADSNGIGRPQLAGAVPRLFGVEFPQVSVVSSEIVQVMSPFELPELAALFGGGNGGGSVSVTAAAMAWVGLWNPNGSNSIIVIEDAHLYNANGANAGIEVGILRNTLAGGVGGWINRDARRWVGNVATGGLQGQLQFQDSAVVPVGYHRIGTFGVLGASTLHLKPQAILPPGWAFTARITTAAAATLHGTFWGRERVVPASELTDL